MVGHGSSGEEPKLILRMESGSDIAIINLLAYLTFTGSCIVILLL